MKFQEIHQLTDDQVEQRFDDSAHLTTFAPSFWRDEIAHRRAERQTEAIKRMTVAMVILTAVVTACTILLVVR